MSKAAASAPEKSTSEQTIKVKVECVLEDVLPVNSDSTIKVKKFKKFLDYDLKTLNITGELQTYIHKNGFTHTKMTVTYQDKTTNKVNYLEIDILDNTNKKVENTKECNDNPCRKQFKCCDCSCDGTGTVSTNTVTNYLGATPKATPALQVGDQVIVKNAGSKYTVFVLEQT